MKIIAACLFLLFISISNGSALTIKNAVSEALNNNLSLLIEDNNLDIAKEDLYQSRASFLPTVAVTGTISETDTSNIKLQTGAQTSDINLNGTSKSIILSQSIFNGFARTYDLAASKSNYDLQKLNLEKNKQDITLQTIEAYYNLLFLQKTHEAYVENYSNINQRFEATKKEFEVGLASKTDVAQAESFMNSAKINMLNSKVNYDNAVNLFDDLIGSKSNDLSFSEIPFNLPSSFTELLERVSTNNLAIQMARVNVDIKKAQVGYARSAYYPKVDLTATKTEFDESTTTIDSGTNEEVSATMTWPIFNSGKSLSNVRKAKEAQNSYLIILQKTQIDTHTLAKKLWDQSEISKDQIVAAESSYKASKTAYEGTVIEQKVGERTILDVLNAQQSLLNSEIELMNQKRNKEIIKSQVFYLMGDLTLENMGN
jgi:TolC family type I secretion outer membrane protein